MVLARRRSLALPMRWRQNFTDRATLCGAGLKLSLSPRLNFETSFGHFLPAMNLISPARNHLVILAGVVEIMRRRQAKRAMEESSRAVTTSDGWKVCLRDQDLSELYKGFCYEDSANVLRNF
jgi:hypothetical protein